MRAIAKRPCHFARRTASTPTDSWTSARMSAIAASILVGRRPTSLRSPSPDGSDTSASLGLALGTRWRRLRKSLDSCVCPMMSCQDSSLAGCQILAPAGKPRLSGGDVATQLTRQRLSSLARRNLARRLECPSMRQQSLPRKREPNSNWREEACGELGSIQPVRSRAAGKTVSDSDWREASGSQRSLAPGRPGAAPGSSSY